MPTVQDTPGGGWRPAGPLGWQGSGLDVELVRDGSWFRWELYERRRLIAARSHRIRWVALGASMTARWLWRHRYGPWRSTLEDYARP
jgi:hypothetical protein